MITKREEVHIYIYMNERQIQKLKIMFNELDIVVVSKSQKICWTRYVCRVMDLPVRNITIWKIDKT